MNVLFGGVAAWGTSIISTGFTVFILLLKLLVAFIQAYVFTILSALFIGMSVEEHDEGGHVPDMEDHDEGEVTPPLGEDGMEENRTRVTQSEAEPATV
jgi:F-type H+-transporting ATPase subunit a